MDHLIALCGLDLCVKDGEMRDLLYFYVCEQPETLGSLWFGFLFYFFSSSSIHQVHPNLLSLNHYLPMYYIYIMQGVMGQIKRPSVT